MGHDPDPAAEAGQLREAIRDAHAAIKDLRAAIREARQLGDGLAAQFEDIASREIRDMFNEMQLVGNEYAAELNAAVETARQEIAQHLFDARIEYDEKADNFAVIFRGTRFAEDSPLPYPERIAPG